MFAPKVVWAPAKSPSGSSRLLDRRSSFPYGPGERMVSLHRAAGGQLRGEGLFQPVSDAIGNKSLLHSEEKVAPRVLLGQGKTEGLARDFAAIPVFAIDRPNPIRAAA